MVGVTPYHLSLPTPSAFAYGDPAGGGSLRSGALP